MSIDCTECFILRQGGILSLMGYFSELIDASFKPNQFWAGKSRKGLLFSAFWFYVITVALQQLMQALVAAYNLRTFSAFSSQVSIFILSIPFYTLGLLLIAALYHGLAKIMHGRGRYMDTLIAVIFSSGPMIIPTVPYLKLIIIVWVAVLLTYGMHAMHRYPKMNAFLTAAIPSFILLVANLVFSL